MQNKIPDGWKKNNLGEVTTLITRGLQPSYTEKEGITVINQKCIRDGKVNLNHARLTDVNKKPIPENRYLKLHDILINSTGTGTVGRVGQITHIDKKLTCDSHVSIIRPNLEEIEGRYLGYTLWLLEPLLENCAEGSTNQVELARARLKSLEIILPINVEEQNKIVSVLSAFDDKIEVNNKIIQTLEQMAQEIFKEWFIVRKKDGKEYSLIDVADYINGGAFGKIINKKRRGLPLIKIAELNRGITDNTEWIDKIVDNKYYINDSDLLFSWSGTVDLFIWEKGKAVLNQHIFNVLPKQTFNKGFIYFLLRNKLKFF